MGNFFKDLKEILLIAEREDNDLDACGYYHTIIQHIDKDSEIVNAYESHNCYMAYIEDDTDGYTDGKIGIYFNNNHTHRYEITLRSDLVWHGYCQCKPEDEGYNPEYGCCGECDWDEPSFHAEKIMYIASGSFQGYEKDMWELQKEWDKEHGKLEEERKQEHIDNIDEKIKELQQQKEMLLKGE